MMPPSWEDLARSAHPPKRPRGGGRRKSFVFSLFAVLVAVAAAAVVLYVRGDGEETPDSPTPPTDGAANAGTPTVFRPVAFPYLPDEEPLAGTELLCKGRLEEAEAQLNNYLDVPTDGRDDQALLALGLALEAMGRKTEAERAFQLLVKRRADSLHAGDALYELGVLLIESGREREGRDALREAVNVYRESSGGARAGKFLADELYESHVVEKKRRSEWERIRDRYSTALRGLAPDGEEREEVLRRLRELNGWIVFTPHSRPAPGYPSNVVHHTVKRGEFLGSVAQKYGVTVGAIKRLNGIAPESDLIRPGDELKVLRGRCEIVIDRGRLRLTAWVDGKFLNEYAVGVGRDDKTPLGEFRIATRQIDPDWTTPDGQTLPFGHPENILGTRWLGFGRRGSGRGIGIHGSVLKDDKWEGVGMRVSNGCIRLANPDVEELYDFAVRGTAVRIVEE